MGSTVSALGFSLGKVPAIGLGCPAQPWLPLLCSFSSSLPPPTVLELSRCLLHHCVRGETIHRRRLEMCLGFLQPLSLILATSLSLLMTSYLDHRTTRSVMGQSQMKEFVYVCQILGHRVQATTGTVEPVTIPVLCTSTWRSQMKILLHLSHKLEKNIITQTEKK